MNINTPKSNNDLYSSHKSYPQMESLFSSLNISEEERKDIEADFYCIARIVYENPQWIYDSYIIRQIKLWETHRDCFETNNEFEKNILNQYFNFIQKYPNWEKIRRVLTAHYKSVK